MKVTVTMPKKFRRSAEDAVQRALSALAALARDRLTTLAQEKLKSSAQAYMRGLSQPVVKDRTAVITLGGAFPNMMEKGSSPYDLKKMLRGRKFVDVPFRHGPPGSKSVQSMPKNDYNVMRMVAASARAAGRARGPRDMPTKPMTVTREGFGKYRHKESKYGSMLVMTHKYKGATQRQYLTIRRISQKSNPASWIHPGFKPLGIFPLVANEVKKLAPKVIAEYVRNMVR